MRWSAGGRDAVEDVRRAGGGVGGRGRRPDGEIATHFLTDPGTDAHRAVQAEAERLTTFLGDNRIRPSLRTPIERRLTT
ncbi:hypothetical protein ADK38_28855 [Streptomyces varsoviensis]|uniref:Uncharacterized protein n=1 Tax=Streptomyces varsoviensis TaxID=67373 RepID=A0ABR5J081_9ACTN|nr:hypothetical protein ADK38_28855 [Streptomyces varsoviensis]